MAAPVPIPADRIASSDKLCDEVWQGAVACIPQLRAFALRLCGNRDRADDLVQEAVLRAMSCAAQYTSGTNFRAWIFTILRNHYFNDLRRHRGRFTSMDEFGSNEPGCASTQESVLEVCEFRRAFLQLSADQRDVLLLVGASGLSYHEAAKICGCAVGTVKSRVSRARQALKSALKNGSFGGVRNESDPVAGAYLLDTLAGLPARESSHMR